MSLSHQDAVQGRGIVAKGMVRREVGGDARSASGAGGARLGCAGSGRAVFHIRPGPAGGGSAESYGKPAIESRGRPSPMCNIPAAGPRVSRPARHRSARRRVSGFDPRKTYPQARPRPSGRGRGNQHHAKGLTLEERTERGRGDAVEESKAPPRDGDAREDDGHAKGPDLADAAGATSVVDPGSRSSDQSPDRLLIQHLVSWGAVRMRRAAPRHHSSPDPHVSAAHRGPAALGTCGAQKQRSEVVGERRPVGGTAPCPPPAAQSGTTAMTTLGMVRMRRWTSRMCRRLARAALMRARASATSAVWSWPDVAVAVCRWWTPVAAHRALFPGRVDPCPPGCRCAPGSPPGSRPATTATTGAGTAGRAPRPRPSRRQPWTLDHSADFADS